jgi:hypothetical protein
MTHSVTSSSYPELSRIAVGDLLIKQGYSLDKVSVELSQVPYRQD